MSEAREPSSPPSAPTPPPRRGRGSVFEAGDGPVRVQLVVALLLGLVLVASGLYLWRRPTTRTSSEAAERAVEAGEADDAGARAAVVVDAAPPPVALSEARTVGCHDRGPKVTSPEDCDHLAPVEQALSHAIEQSLSCVPQGEAGGTIEYVADVSFSRHKLRITLPRSGRSFRDRKVVAACSAAVRDAMRSVDLNGLEHQHARYQIAITATYRGKS